VSSALSTVAFTFDPGSRGRDLAAALLQGVATPVFLIELDDTARATALAEASALVAFDTGKELRHGEATLLTAARLIQFMTAGVDHIPLSQLPAGVTVAKNGGAYAASMAEHAIAMILTASKRLMIEHAALVRGEFNQFARNRMLRDMTCGILGFGGIGTATARLLRCFGARVHAINRSGRTGEDVDWIGTTDDLMTMLRAIDVLVIAAPLTTRTVGMIGSTQLAAMKPDALLVNLARGELVDEAALFAHLRAHPNFFACIDAWWVEPIRHGVFRMDHAFLSLPNVIGSPHNSASVAGNAEAGLRHALKNVRRVLTGQPAGHVVDDEERMR
jgi:phosphoglycerate dehydrogenase-like enzyme